MAEETILAGRDSGGGAEMTHEAAEAYAYMAYRTIAYEENAMTEEYLEILIDMLYGFYTPQEIKRIYRNDLQFDSYNAVMNDEKIKGK